jgi:hypothetical protein
MPDRFPSADLDALRQARLAEVLTGPSDAPRRTTIWVVVDDHDRVLVRSVRGPRGRWYRDLLADPAGVLNVAGTRIPFVAQGADDEERIAACSMALRAKYRPGESLDSMLKDDTLSTTLELLPRPA